MAINSISARFYLENMSGEKSELQNDVKNDFLEIYKWQSHCLASCPWTNIC